jgi:hypothetical protein
MQRITHRVAAAAALILVLSAAPARADTMTLTTSGTIGYGYDNNGIFGVGTSLDGQAFWMTVTLYSESLNIKRTSDSTYHLSNASSTAVLTGRVTVGSHTYSWSSFDAGGNVDLVNNLTANRHGNDAVDISGGGTNKRDGFIVGAGSGLYSEFVDFLTNVEPSRIIDFGPWLSDPSLSAGSRFSTVAPDGTRTYFSSSPGLSQAIWISSPVPEPTQLGMLVAGLAALAFAARRRHWYDVWAPVPTRMRA